MNWLDRAIGWIAPQAGVRRIAARAALAQIAQLQARKFEAAGNSRRTQGWRATNGSANAELSDAINTLRKRSRDIIRNNPYAESACDKWAASAVATGITPTFDNAQANKVFRRWAKRCAFDGIGDFSGVQAIAARALFESGDAILLRKYVAPEYEGDIGLRMHLIEADYLDIAKHGPQSNGNHCVLGQEFDAQGRRVALHLFDAHPGDTGYRTRGTNVSRRWSTADAVYLYRPERPGQMLGKPELASALLKLRDLDEYEEAELIRKKIEACFVAFVHGAEGTRTLAETATVTTADGKTRRTESLSPGIIEYLGQGEDVTFGTPSVSNNTEYVAHHLRAIAAGCGMTYEQLTGDYSKVTMGTLRFAVEQFRAMVDAWRWLVFIPQFCYTAERWFLEAAYDFGPLRGREYDCEWNVPRWSYIEPVKDVQAVKEEIKGGLVSLPTAMRERGRDPALMLKETAEYQAELEKAGVTVDTVGANTVKAAAAEQDEQDAREAAQLEADAEKAEEEERRHRERLAAEERHARALEALAARETPAPVINVAAPEMRVEAPVVNVAPPEVRVEAPVVNVAPADVHVTVDAKKGATVREVVETDADGIPTKVIERPAE